MHIQVSRSFDGSFINSILNLPEVRPYVSEDAYGALDISPQLLNRDNYLIQGEHGGVLFLQLIPGIYECHTVVHPSVRGWWTKKLTDAVAWYMYTRTDCVEITTRVPKGHLPALGAAKSAGMRLEFDIPDGCTFLGSRADLHVLSFRLQDWLPTAPYLKERGAWFHKRLAEEALRVGITEPPHPPDDQHNQYVGGCIDMAFAGQFRKAECVYNRWARMTRHPTVSLIGERSVRFDVGVLEFTADDIRIVPCN